MAFTGIANNVAHTTINVNTSQSSTNGYIGRIQLIADTGYQFKSGVGNYSLIANEAFINNQSTITYNAALPDSLKVSADNLFTFNFSRYTYQVRYTYTPITINGEVEPISAVTITNNITDTTETHTIDGDTITINVVGSITNYRFVGSPTITYTDTDGVTQTAVCSVSVENGISTATATISDANLTVNTFTINGTYAQYVEIVNNINGVTETHTVYNNDVTINLTGTLNGYQIGANTYVTYTNTNGETATAYFTRTDGNTRAHVYLTDCNTEYTVTINGVYELVVNVVNNIANVTDGYTYDGENLTFTIIGNTTNYRFYTPPTITYTDTNGITQTTVCSVSVDGNTSTATATITNADLSEIFTINGNYDKIVPFTIDASNCDVSGVNEYAVRDGVYNFTATANEYYKFTVAPTVTLYKLNDSVILSFVISATETSATVTLDIANYTADFDDLTRIVIRADAAIDAQYLDKYGAINVYNVDNDNLIAFASKRFFSGDPTNPQLIDLGNYVCSLKRLFVDLANVPLIPNVLRCGNYNTEIDVFTPLFDVLTLDCGAVDIPQHNNNLTDLNAEISMFLPFVGFVDLPSDFCGKTINVNYVCNIVTSNAVANLICNGVTFAQYDCNISSDLYYKTNETNYSVKASGKLDFNNYVLKGLTPFVTCKWYTDENKKIYNSDSKRGVLSTFSGYVQCTEISGLNIVAPSEIIEMIMRELENGVIL